MRRRKSTTTRRLASGSPEGEDIADARASAQAPEIDPDSRAAGRVQHPSGAWQVSSISPIAEEPKDESVISNRFAQASSLSPIRLPILPPQFRGLETSGPARQQSLAFAYQAPLSQPDNVSAYSAPAVPHLEHDDSQREQSSSSLRKKAVGSRTLPQRGVPAKSGSTRDIIRQRVREHVRANAAAAAAATTAEAEIVAAIRAEATQPTESLSALASLAAAQPPSGTVQVVRFSVEGWGGIEYSYFATSLILFSLVERIRV